MRQRLKRIREGGKSIENGVQRSAVMGKRKDVLLRQQGTGQQDLAERPGQQAQAQRGQGAVHAAQQPRFRHPPDGDQKYQPRQQYRCPTGNSGQLVQKLLRIAQAENSFRKTGQLRSGLCPLLHKGNRKAPHFHQRRVSFGLKAYSLQGKLRILWKLSFENQQVSVVSPLLGFQERHLLPGPRLAGGGEDIGRVGEARNGHAFAGQGPAADLADAFAAFPSGAVVDFVQVQPLLVREQRSQRQLPGHGLVGGLGVDGSLFYLGHHGGLDPGGYDGAGDQDVQDEASET